MTTLCLCDWVDVSDDRQRSLLPIAGAVTASSERAGRGNTCIDNNVAPRSERFTAVTLQTDVCVS